MIESDITLYGLFNKGPVMIFRWKNEKNWPVSFVSNNVEKIIGYTSEELLSGKVFYASIIHADDYERVVNEVHAAANSQKEAIFHQEYRILHKNGNIVWLKDFTNIIYDDNSNIIEYIGYVLDITRQKFFYDEMMFKEERYQVLFESAEDGILLLNGLMIDDCNPKACEMFSLSREEVTKFSILMLSPKEQFNGESSEIYSKKLIELALDDQPQMFEWDYFSSEHTVSKALVKLNKVIFENKIFTLAILRDISEFKRIRYDNELLSNMIEQSPLAVIRTNLGFEIEYMNESAINLFGYDFDELKGKTPAVFNAEKDSVLIQKEIYDNVSGGKSVSREILNKKKNGEKFICQFKVSPLRDNDSRIIGYMSFLRDASATTYLRRELEEIFNMSVDMICIADMKTFSFKKINKAFTSVLGFTETELLNCSFLELIHPDDVEATKTVINARLSLGEKILSFENRYRTKDNNYRWLSWVSHPEPERGLTYAIARDVTDKKIIEERLRKSEENYRLLIENQSDLIVKVDPEGRFQYVSQTYCDLFGKTSEELIGQRFIPLVHKDDIENTLKEMEKLAIPPYSCRVEQRALTKIGWRWLSWSDKAVIDENGKVIAIIGAGRDITQRKEAETALLESEKKYRNIIENIQDSYFRIDCNGIINMSSPSAKKLLGYEYNEDIVGKNLIGEFFAAKKDADSFRSLILKTAEIINYEIKLKKKNGKVVNALASFRSVFSETDSLLGFEGILTDITERKILEEQLEIRQRMDSLGNLAGGIAHDFNNLLTGILGNLNMLQLHIDSLSADQREFVENAFIAANRAADLTKSMQTLSRGGANKISNIDLYNPAREIFKMLEETTDRMIKKDITFEKNQFIVKANHTELGQIILNLSTNSIHSIEQNGVKPDDYIRISAEAIDLSLPDKSNERLITFSEHLRKRYNNDTKEKYIHILFEDSGCGMSEEVRKKAFDPLFTTKEKSSHKGQGLGLAMVYSIITRNFNGLVEIESEEGQGTKIHIVLPEADKYDEQQVIQQKILEFQTSGTVIVIDDELMVTQFIEKSLSQYGFKVLSAHDGEKGLELYMGLNKQPALVIIDLTMPKISGYKVLQMIKTMNPEVKTLIISGHSEEKTQNDIITKADGFLEKPFSVNRLMDKVSEILNRKI